MASLRASLACLSLRRTSTLTRNSIKTNCTRKFHNGPPVNPRGEKPWSYSTQSKVFWSGLAALTTSCIFAYSVDLFKPKFGELDWDKIREERNARRAEEMDDEDDDEDDDEEEVAEEEVEEAIADEVEAASEDMTEESTDEAAEEAPVEEPTEEETVVEEPTESVEEAPESVEVVEEIVAAVEETVEVVEAEPVVEMSAEDAVTSTDAAVEEVSEEASDEAIVIADVAAETGVDAVEAAVELAEEVSPEPAVEAVVEPVSEVPVVEPETVTEEVAAIVEAAPIEESFDVIDAPEVAEAAAATENVGEPAEGSEEEHVLVEETPADETRAEETSAEETSAEETSAEETSAEEPAITVEKSLVEEIISPAVTDAKLPEKVQYLLIGAGTASVSAMRAVLKNDPQAEILMIGAEPHHPYMRPPLSKELWFSEDKEAASQMVFKDWSGKERSLFYPDLLVEPSQLGPGSPALLKNTRVVKLDPTKQCVVLSSGEEISYQKCLLAPGGDPKSLGSLIPTAETPCLSNSVHLFRNIEQFKQLSKELSADTKVLVVGGGFLGSELAYAITRTGAQVHQTFPESGNMGKVLPKYLSNWTTKELQRASVNVIPESKVVGTTCKENGKIEVALNTGVSLDVDHILVAVGLEPSTELGDSAGLEVHSQMGGYVVNAELEARSNLYVAGDAACFYDPVLGRRRVEHHDHAVVSGKLAGENMAGATKPYHHQSMFWSDLGPNIGYEAIGLIDSSLPTVGIWAHSDKQSPDIQADPSVEEKYEKGIVFYMNKDKVVGVVTWNIFGKIPIARKVIGAGEEHTDFGRLAKQFDIHATDE